MHIGLRMLQAVGVYRQAVRFAIAVIAELAGDHGLEQLLAAGLAF
mgnify:CR=1 FL=1